MSLTSAQQAAIAARGNVLVMAGAGTGKTRTLVERCLNCLLQTQSPASLDEILMVTFTEAAAAEMRQRIRVRLEQELEKHPGESRFQEQLALFETAHIGTLHSFCLQLVRQHFHHLELDPQITVLPEEEAYLLGEETLDGLLQGHYAGKSRQSEAIQRLIQVHGQGRDQPIRALVRRLHQYSQTLPDPDSWFLGQRAHYANAEPVAWHALLAESIDPWRTRWLARLASADPDNRMAVECRSVLETLGPRTGDSNLALALAAIPELVGRCPRGNLTRWIKPLKPLLAEVAYLASLSSPREAEDPLAQDWAWVRTQMTTLLDLAKDFTRHYCIAKRELGVVDFQDLEQFALQLLWDPVGNQPTRVAHQWKEKLRFVFVDEYQDINAAQDKIIQALSRDGGAANRFLVGDVKQSIYRFRLAKPAIFQSYARTWRGALGQVIPLADNFRSRETILNFVNSLFSTVMQEEIGGVVYDALAQLRFGAAEQHDQRGPGSPVPDVELRLRTRGWLPSQEAEEEIESAANEIADLDEADKEARLVALRLRELKADRFPVWDELSGSFRPVQWADMAILLRAPSGKAESYAKEFSRLNLPLLVSHGGFYRSLEISDLLSLLQVLDNPLQDLPLLAVLHSPLVGLCAEDLANIRLTSKGAFWNVLRLWIEKWNRRPGSESSGEVPGIRHAQTAAFKVSAFLEQFARWRRLAREVSLSRCLEAVLVETHYADWVLTLARGGQRYANLERFLHLARQFDQFQRQGLFRFLRFIEAQRAAEAEPQVAAASTEDCVRLMSIHQSKGLEFPIIVLADLGKPFNVADQRTELILDEQYGLCPQIKPPRNNKRYPSLPFWLARQRQHREMLGEELRLLYVAVTRARDHLILTGSTSAARYKERWQPADARALPGLVASAKTSLDWLGCWFGQHAGCGLHEKPHGESAYLRWSLEDESQLLRPPQVEPALAPSSPIPESDLAAFSELEQRLNWKYGAVPATVHPAKTSVTALRRHGPDSDEVEAAGALDRAVYLPVHSDHLQRQGVKWMPAEGAAAGTAHHHFLEFLALDRVESLDALKNQARQLVDDQKLTADEAKLLDFDALAAFWTSKLGQRIRRHARDVRRELSFTARFAPGDLSAFSREPCETSLASEYMVVQGVADLVVVLPRELWLVDFKTDHIKSNDVADRAQWYDAQMHIYASALSRIYQRKVTGCWLYFLTCRKAWPVSLERLSHPPSVLGQFPGSANQLSLPLG